MNHARTLARPRLAIVACALACLATASCQSPVGGANASSGMGDTVPDGVLLQRAMRSAERASRTSDPVRAEQYYREATSIYPEFAAAWNNMGLTLMSQERWSEADEAFALATDLAAFDPRPLYNRGLIRLKRGYAEQSIPYFERAIELNPNFLPALRAGIRAEILTRQTGERTLTWLERAIMLETDESWLKYLRLQRLQIDAEVNQERPAWVR